MRGAIRLVAPDPRALELGLTRGLALADARSCVPELAVFDHDPAEDRRWLERIADACDRFSPSVATDATDGIILDIAGCEHLFDDEAGLASDLERHMARFTPHLRQAFADTPEAAQALARFREGPATDEQIDLRRLPIAALRLDQDTQIALLRAGLTTIGDIADRPSAPLAARFGESTTALLARLFGQADSRITPRRAPPALFFERRFAEPIARTEDALGTIDALCREAIDVLETRHEGGRRFAARLFRTDGIVRDLKVETGLPSRDPAVLARLFRERVDALADPIDPGFGFDMIRLAIPSTEPLGPAQLQLEGGSISEEALAALVDRLSTRVGRGRIRRFAPLDTHIPEQAVLTLPASDPPAPVQWPRPEPGEPPLRPIHLFDPPQPVEVLAEIPDGPPRRFKWRREHHQIVRSEGPERIAAEWWRHSDGKGLTRDYYRVEDVRGRRFWLFRHGLYESEKNDPRWYVHGLFA